MKKSEKWVWENMGEMPSEHVLDEARERLRELKIERLSQPVTAKKRKTPWMAIATACVPAVLLVCLVPWLLRGADHVDGVGVLPYNVTENVQIKDFAAEHNLVLYGFDIPGQTSNLISTKEGTPIGFDVMVDFEDDSGDNMELALRFQGCNSEFGLFKNWEPIGKLKDGEKENIQYQFWYTVAETGTVRLWIEFTDGLNQYRIVCRGRRGIQNFTENIKIFM